MIKTILVAGGTGFIGSHLCEKLLNSGNKVICLDNLSTGDKKNIESFQTNQNFQFVEGDTREISNVIRSTNSGQISNIQEIYDLASPASVTYIMDHPIEAATANSIGTKNLLDFAKEKKAKFLFASSSETYGDPKEHPQKESYWGNVNPVGVRSGYDEGKRFGEALSMAYHREFRVDVKIVRIFNTYGPNSSPKDTRVIPRFVTQALNREALTVHGNGEQTRSLCYVSDMVEGLVKMMESEETGPINLGNNNEMKIIEIAQKVIEATNSTSKITFVERLSDDPSVRKPDIDLAKTKLNWDPKVSLDEGLKLTIDYFKKILKDQ